MNINITQNDLNSLRRRQLQKHQYGFTIIELLAALAIGIVMLVGLSAMIDNTMADTKGQQTALYQSQVVAAAKKMIELHYSDLTSSVGVTKAYSVADLTADHFLPTGFATTNPYGQTPCVLVRPSTYVIGTDTHYRMDALVVTEGTSSQAIPDIELGFIAANSGQGGGGLYSSASTVAQGAFGSWQITASTTPSFADFQATNCSGTKFDIGSVTSALMYNGSGQSANDFLYRNIVPGHPELNQMNVPIAMANGALVTEGAACTTIPAIAFDATSYRMVSCNIDGKWEPISTWKPSVETYTDFATLTNNRDGDVRMVRDRHYAFMYDSGVWRPLAADQNGDMLVTGKLTTIGDSITNGDSETVGKITAGNSLTVQNGHLSVDNGDVNAPNGSVLVGNDVKAGKNLIAGQDATIGRDVAAGRDINAIGNIHAKSSLIADIWTVSPAYLVQTVYTASDACNVPGTDTNGNPIVINPTGTVVRDNNGLILTCAIDSTFRYANGAYTP